MTRALLLVVACVACGRLRFDDRLLVDDAAGDDATRDASACPTLCPDPSFTPAGMLLLDLAAGDNAAWGSRALVERRDGSGRLVVVGRIDTRAVAVGLEADGRRDMAFGTNGVSPIDINGTGTAPDAAHAIVERPTGDFVLAGPTGFTCWIMGLNSNGNTDPAFNGGAAIVTDAGGTGDCVFNGLIVDAADRIVAGGQARYVAYDMALHRRLPDGSVDTGFSTDGSHGVDISGGSDDFGNLATLGPGGTYYLVGVGYYGGPTPGYEPQIARVLDDGTLDPTFGTGGFVLPDPTIDPDVLDDLTRDSADRVIAVGGAGSDLYVLRLDSNGDIDPSFGTGGDVRIAQPTPARLYGVTVLPDGRIVVGGARGTAATETAVLAILADDGSVLDVRDLGLGAPSRVSQVQVDSQGRVLVSGYAPSTGNDIFIMRMLP